MRTADKKIKSLEDKITKLEARKATLDDKLDILTTKINNLSTQLTITLAKKLTVIKVNLLKKLLRDYLIIVSEGYMLSKDRDNLIASSVVTELIDAGYVTYKFDHSAGSFGFFLTDDGKETLKKYLKKSK